MPRQPSSRNATATVPYSASTETAVTAAISAVNGTASPAVNNSAANGG